MKLSTNFTLKLKLDLYS